ncbi:MAG: heparinase II/III-family protein [Sedimentisphaerales bacterium]|nr:heparinase II/III-family protein [Sedimentisphaerales bacterium]
MSVGASKKIASGGFGNMLDKPGKSLLIAIIVLIAFGIAAPATHAQNNKPASPHPRLYYTPQRIQAFKAKIDADPKIKQAWTEMLTRAERLLDEDLVSIEYAESGSGQHGNYGRPSSQISNMGTTLGLAYQMTANSKYAEKLRRAMIHFGQLKRWAGDAQRDPPWNSELNTARFCFGYAVGYDSIRSCLSETDKTAIVAAMVQRGILPTLNDWILPEKRIHALDSMGHNWWSVCVAMAGAASLSVLEDEPQASGWVDSIAQGFPEWFAYQGNVLQNKSRNFDRNGAFYESVGYADYALSEYLLFLLAYSNVFPDAPSPAIPMLKDAGDFFVNASYPTSSSLLSANFGDSSINASGAKTLRLLLANGFDKPAYHWYLTKTDPGLRDPISIVSTKITETPIPPANLPKSVIYPDIGWAMMRSSWTDNATMLAVKSGFAWNHAHPDAGSFILFHKGKSLIIDSGNCSYSRREYTDYYRQSKAHNVILTDGQAENPEACGGPDRGVVHPGALAHLMDLAGIKYVLADATGPTSWKFSRNYRHFLWIDNLILVLDDIRTHEPGQLEWLLHFEGRAEQNAPGIRLSNGDKAAAIVRPLFPKNMAVAKKTGLKNHNPDMQVEYLAFTPPDKSRDMKFITAILPLENPEDKPNAQLELLEADEMIGVRISRDKEITDVFLNLRADGRRMHRNSNNIVQGWNTDAAIFGITRPAGAPDDPDSITRCFVICGSYLRKNGKVVMDSLSKVYSIFQTENGEMNVTLRGQPITNCRIRAKTKPKTAILNSRKTTLNWDNSTATVTFAVTGRQAN